jgi:hypothetical protein
MLQEEVFAVLFMNELKNLTNVVIGKLGKLVHKQDCSRDFYFYFMNYNITIVRVRYITIETKEVARIGYNGFLFRQFTLRWRHSCYTPRPSPEYPLLNSKTSAKVLLEPLQGSPNI